MTETIYPDDAPDEVEKLIQAIAPGQTVETIDWTQVVYPDQAPNYLDGNPRSSTEYYKDGQVKAETDELGERVEYDYDPAGRLFVTRFDENNYNTYSYDAAGNRLSETYFAEGTEFTTSYDTLARVVGTTDAEGKTVNFEYNPVGQLASVIDALGGRTEYSYDALGNLTSVEDALGQTTSYQYDAQGRRTATVRADNNSSTIAYDSAENTTTVTDFNGETVLYKYDDLGALESKSFNGTSVAISYATDNADGSTEERIADSRGTTVYSYDSVGRLLSRTDPTGPYLASGATIEYEYADGLLSAVKTPGNTKTYTYEEGLLKTVSDSEVGTTTYFYDSDNVFRTQFPNNVLETRTYDELGRLEFVETAKVDRSSGAKTEIISTYDYELDDVGNRLEVLENSGRQVQYQYDDLHRLIREEISNDPTGNNRVITYSYDAAGNRIQKSDSVAGNTTYIYNELNQLESETTNGVTSTYSYDSNGSLISRVTGDSSVTYEWVNDGENRLAGVTITDSSGTSNIEYEYNARGIRVGEIVDGVETRFLIDDSRRYPQVLAEYDAALNRQASYTYGYWFVNFNSISYLLK